MIGLFYVLLVLASLLWIARILMAVLGGSQAVKRILIHCGFETHDENVSRARRYYRNCVLHPFTLLGCLIPFSWVWFVNVVLDKRWNQQSDFAPILPLLMIAGFGVLLWGCEFARLCWIMKGLPAVLSKSTVIEPNDRTIELPPRDLKNPYEAPRSS